MLKVIGSEMAAAYHRGQRLVYLLTRDNAIAKAEAQGPKVSSGSHRRIIFNDVAAY